MKTILASVIAALFLLISTPAFAGEQADLYCISTNGAWYPCSSSQPLPIIEPIPSATVQFQAKIAVTGTAVQLAANALSKSLSCYAKTTNVATIEFGTSSVNNTVDGTGNGAIVPAGAGWAAAVSNSNAVWINGTAGDIISCWGN